MFAKTYLGTLWRTSAQILNKIRIDQLQIPLQILPKHYPPVIYILSDFVIKPLQLLDQFQSPLHNLIVFPIGLQLC